MSVPLWCAQKGANVNLPPGHGAGALGESSEQLSGVKLPQTPSNLRSTQYCHIRTPPPSPPWFSISTQLVRSQHHESFLARHGVILQQSGWACRAAPRLQNSPWGLNPAGFTLEELKMRHPCAQEGLDLEPFGGEDCESLWRGGCSWLLRLVARKKWVLEMQSWGKHMSLFLQKQNTGLCSSLFFLKRGGAGQHQLLHPHCSVTG